MTPFFSIRRGGSGCKRPVENAEAGSQTVAATTTDSSVGSSPTAASYSSTSSCSVVYGEHILYPMTVQGIQWAIERRAKFSEFGPAARLLLNENGNPLDQQTINGNAAQIIPNHFSRLIKRIQDDENEIRPLSFGKLRKTASQLIRHRSDGEVMGVFDCHGYLSGSLRCRTLSHSNAGPRSSSDPICLFKIETG